MKGNIMNELIRVMTSPAGEVEVGKTFRVMLEISNTFGWIENVQVLFNQYGEGPSIVKQMKKEEENDGISVYCAEVQFNRLGNYFFFFSLEINGKAKVIKISRKTNQPMLMYPWEESPYWRELVINQGFEVPKWSQDAIAYQLFVDRFCKGGKAQGTQEGRQYRVWGEFPDWKRNSSGEFHNNDFFCGNIEGICKMLEYLKSLCVDIVYLSPINESLYRYERYASTNHMEIDQDAGTFEDLDKLHKRANEMGMHIILDIAFNHCSSDNPIFKEAMSNPNSKYRDWFYINGNSYICWYGIFTDMPIFNQQAQGYQDYVYGKDGVVAKFAPYVDGFRLDLASELQPFVLEGIRNRANEYGKHLILGEYWHKVPIEILGKGLDCPTNYPFTDAILKFVAFGRGADFAGKICDVLESYPKKTIDTMFNSLDTHDMMRAITILSLKCVRDEPDRIWEIDKEGSRWHVVRNGRGEFLTDDFRQFEFDNDKLGKEEYDLAIRRLKVAVILQYFLPGIPCTFYGTEVGMHGFKDPFNRKCFPWNEENQDRELFSFYQEIGKFRKLYHGEGSTFEVLYADQDVFIFERRNETNSVFVAVNRGEQRRYVDVPEDFKGDAKTFTLNANEDQNYLEPYGGMIILK